MNRAKTDVVLLEGDGIGPEIMDATLKVLDALDLGLSYDFVEADRGTDVTYHLRVDLIIPLPGFVKRRAEARIMSTALTELRSYVTA